MTMRCYVPACRSMLVAIVEGNAIPAATSAYAVTPALLAATTAAGSGEDDEEAEYAAMMLAAEASLPLLDPVDPADRRRVVLAVDADVAAQQHADSGADRALGEIRLRRAARRDQIAAVHIDSDDDAPGSAVGLVDQAVAALQAGDSDRLEPTLEALVEVDLEWYAPSELDSVL